jgi:hypothetical protein
MVKSKGMFRLGIQQFQKANNVIGLAYAIGGLASLLVKQDQPEHAERLFAWSDAVREKFNDFRPPIEQASVERDLAVIHSKWNHVQLASLSAEGRSMTVEPATAYALELSVDS